MVNLRRRVGGDRIARRDAQMLNLLLPVVGLLTGPARPVPAPSARTGVRACVRAVVADAPSGFTWVSMPAHRPPAAHYRASCMRAPTATHLPLSTRMPTRTGLRLNRPGRGAHRASHHCAGAAVLSLL